MKKIISTILIMVIILNSLMTLVIANTSVLADKIELGHNQSRGYYIYGNFIHSEIKQSNIILKSSDNQIIKDVYINKIGDMLYYFDRYITGLDLSKEYMIQINPGTNFEEYLWFGNKVLGVMDGYKIILDGTILRFEENKYSGDVFIELNEVSLNTSGSRQYISGNITYKEFLNGEELEVNKLPKIALKSIDGEIKKDAYVAKVEKNKYYFDRFLEGLDYSKQYIMEVECGNDNNQSQIKKWNINFGTRTLGEYNSKYIITTYQDKISFNKIPYNPQKIANLKELNMATNKYGTYIYGKIEYKEIVNGKVVNLTENPIIELKSTDLEVESEAYVAKTGVNEYYFDRYIDKLDKTKLYNLSVISREADNDPIIDLDLGNRKLGVFEKYKVTLENKILKIQEDRYHGDVQGTLEQIDISNYNNRDYIHGIISYKEIENGIEVEVEKNPRMTLKTSDGRIVEGAYIRKEENNDYYFDIYIDALDHSQTYLFEIESGDIRNESLNKVAILDFNNRELSYRGKDHIVNIDKQNKLSIQNNSGKMIEANIKSFSLQKNADNYSYITGQIDYRQIINGIYYDSNVNPVIVLRSTDGEISRELYVAKTGSYTYYFDRYIDGLDTNKEYILEIKSEDSKNGDIIKFNNYYTDSNYKYTIWNYTDEFFKLDSQSYIGDINTNIIEFRLNSNSNGIYVYGDFYYTEIVDGMNRVMDINPKAEIVSTDGTIRRKMYVKSNGNGEYYFDAYLNGLNISKEYVIKITSLDKRNISENTTKNLNLPDKYLGLYYEYKVNCANNNIKFTEIKYTKLETGLYGQSGLMIKGDPRGSYLRYYKIGNGPNVFFGTFSVHAFEDFWNFDGIELTRIAEDFVNKLHLSDDEEIAKKWTIYIFPQVNPDGAGYGWTNNGPGRQTVYSWAPGNAGIDMNRCWQTGTYAEMTGRNYNGTQPFQAFEAGYLRDFMVQHKSVNGQTVVVDLHGWTTQLIGDEGIGLNYYGKQFYNSDSEARSRYTSSYGRGYMINWCRTGLASNGKNARTALIELPAYYGGKKISNHQDVVNAKYSEKYYNATYNLLKGLL